MSTNTEPAPSPSTVLEALRAARELISDPDRWTQKHLARNEEGVPVDPIVSPDACQFCAMGALLKVAGGSDLYPDACDALSNQAPRDRYYRPFSVPCVNDHYGHEAVLELFDRAIAAEAA